MQTNDVASILDNVAGIIYCQMTVLVAYYCTNYFIVNYDGVNG